MNGNNKENTPTSSGIKNPPNKKASTSKKNKETKTKSPTLVERAKYFVTNFTDTVSSKFNTPQSKNNNILNENNSTSTKTKTSLNFLKKKEPKISSEALLVSSVNAPKKSIKNTLAGSQSVPLKRKSIEVPITKSPSRKLSRTCFNETFTLEKIAANNNYENLLNISNNDSTFDDSDKDPTFLIGKQ